MGSQSTYQPARLWLDALTDEPFPGAAAGAATPKRPAVPPRTRSGGPSARRRSSGNYSNSDSQATEQDRSHTHQHQHHHNRHRHLPRELRPGRLDDSKAAADQPHERPSTNRASGLSNTSGPAGPSHPPRPFPRRTSSASATDPPLRPPPLAQGRKNSHVSARRTSFTPPKSGSGRLRSPSAHSQSSRSSSQVLSSLIDSISAISPQSPPMPHLLAGAERSHSRASRPGSLSIAQLALTDHPDVSYPRKLRTGLVADAAATGSLDAAEPPVIKTAKPPSGFSAITAPAKPGSKRESPFPSPLALSFGSSARRSYLRSYSVPSPAGEADGPPSDPTPDEPVPTTPRTPKRSAIHLKGYSKHSFQRSFFAAMGETGEGVPSTAVLYQTNHETRDGDVGGVPLHPMFRMSPQSSFGDGRDDYETELSPKSSRKPRPERTVPPETRTPRMDGDGSGPQVPVGYPPQSYRPTGMPLQRPATPTDVPVPLRRSSLRLQDLVLSAGGIARASRPQKLASKDGLRRVVGEQAPKPLGRSVTTPVQMEDGFGLYSREPAELAGAAGHSGEATTPDLDEDEYNASVSRRIRELKAKKEQRNREQGGYLQQQQHNPTTRLYVNPNAPQRPVQPRSYSQHAPPPPPPELYDEPINYNHVMQSLERAADTPDGLTSPVAAHEPQLEMRRVRRSSRDVGEGSNSGSNSNNNNNNSTKTGLYPIRRKMVPPEVRLGAPHLMVDPMRSISFDGAPRPQGLLVPNDHSIRLMQQDGRRAFSAAQTQQQQQQYAEGPFSARSAESGSRQQSVEEEVRSYLDAERLSRKVHDPVTDRLITFSDVGDPKGHVVICCVGMGLTRYITVFYDGLAKTLGLRLITPDRPGVGESEPDPNGSPLSWPDDVQTICSLLGIKRFSILAHSAGAIYALATALRMPQQIRGKIHLLSPWIPPSQLSPIGSSVLTDSAAVSTVQLPKSQRLLRVLPTTFLKVANSGLMAAAAVGNGAAGTKSRVLAKGAKRQNPVPSRDQSRGPSFERAGTGRAAGEEGGGGWVVSVPEESDEDEENADRKREYDQEVTAEIWTRATQNAQPLIDLLVCIERNRTIGFRYEDVTKPVVVHHGSKDTRVPVENVRMLGRMMKDRWEVRILEGEPHGLMARASVMVSVLSEIAEEWEFWETLVRGVPAK